MSELHKFLFDGLPVRGMIVRLTDAWQEILTRRRADDAQSPWPWPVTQMLGEMAAASALMQANIKFNGALIMQIFGEGPVKVAVAEVQHDLSLRVTAKVVGEVEADAHLQDLVNVNGRGRCAITLDPKDRLPGQQAYQGVVPLNATHGEGQPNLADVLEHYMRQSEQLDTRLVLAADNNVAAGLLIQRLPAEGESNIRGMELSEQMEHFNRIATLTASLTGDELLQLDVETILRRLFWQEKMLRFDPQTPRFACTCSRERVTGMIRGLGREEAESILEERGEIDVSCDFCGQHYRFDAVDAAQIFMAPGDQPPASSTMQ
ncbi:Hsp33 family molecular chaperone HslO [Ramlibacter sp. USB13]|uniref:Hsp33 family molecular chaperone HslO n=1 Tax=Ramlibacter cellulosilyticus TaxID=2764187 RepID=A0A923MPB3_9BURK|nr:Hsp33 family molecular chaperone HslO [Ramlibacter cellulosilyticus]MBC5782406.1 Hsp33 family molecular chaperone HslO [Ramlibacter cellulosilyticus]